MLPEKLETERLMLKKVSVEWLEDILAANVGNVAQFFLNFSATNEIHTWINECRAQQDRGERLTLAVLSKEDREFLGLASVLSLNIEPQFSIWIKEGTQGNGFGKEAVKCLLDWFKGTFGASQKIIYLAEKDNLVSIKLANSLGMKNAGIRENTEGKMFQELQI